MQTVTFRDHNFGSYQIQIEVSRFSIYTEDGVTDLLAFGVYVHVYTSYQVVTQNIEDSVDRNTADVFIEASSLQTTGRTIYAVYNDSGGKSCGEFVVMKLEP